MDILFANPADAVDWNSSERLARRFSAQRAKLLRRRLDDLRAAPSLLVMRALPGRCHELKGDRKGQLSIDLEGPYRLIFKPAHNPPPAKPDGGLDWAQVTAIVIIEIGNTHE